MFGKRNEKKAKAKKEPINIREKVSQGHVRAILLLEILGRPKDYLSKALKVVTARLDKDKEIHVLSKKHHRPKQVKEEQVFAAFAEVEVLSPTLLKLMEICFDYMPSSIEIVEPAELKMNLQQSNSIINDLASRLHKYDAVVKRLNLENQIMKAKLGEPEEK